MSEKTVSSKRPGPAQQRRVIEKAAIDLMASKGTAAVSVSQICQAAGISRDTYYRCFEDKEALIGHLYQHAVNDHIEAVLSGWDVDYSDRAWLHRVFDQTIDAILQQHKVAQFLYREASDPNSTAYEIVQGAYGQVVDRMQRWCQDTQGKKPSREYLQALLMATQWLVQDVIQRGLDPVDVRKAKTAAEQLFYAAFSGLPDEVD